MEPLEVKALARIVDELSYYQLLDVEAAATTDEIKRAYYTTSRRFHPDANRQIDDRELRAQYERIAKRVTEAYCVLRDPKRRRVYDQQVSENGRVRIQLAEARAAHQKLEAKTRQGSTAQGRQFHQKALRALEAGNSAQAASHLQMALTFEPGNPHFRELLEQTKASGKAAARR